MGSDKLSVMANFHVACEFDIPFLFFLHKLSLMDNSYVIFVVCPNVFAQCHI